ncbi:hypothetical protein KKH23_07050 [Patescibacteria group bacterium]|uniref:Uncharacterized protein n=1 Tax=viral metagenome TaxID=1070528 RepID=A0A6M3LWJ3_9ZZZZ|nr:hypothetical protein [Patescibacteria group bacterium]
MLSNGIVRVGNIDVDYTIENARQVVLHLSKYEDIEELWSDRENISSICINGDEKNSFCIGGYVVLDFLQTNSRFDIYNIKKLDNKVYLISTCPETKASYFLLPALGFTKKDLLYNSLFVNCYVPVRKPGALLLLVYRYTNHSSFKTLDTLLHNSNLFKGHVYVDFCHTCYKMALYEQYHKDYKHFIKGRYSSLSEPLKQKILSFYGHKKDEKLGRILYKNPELRKQLEIKFGEPILPTIDLWDKPNIKVETLFN